MKRAMTLMAGAIFLSGCAAFFQPAAEEAARGIVKYCEEPLETRSLFRNSIQAELPEGYSVAVHCPGDPS